MNRNLTFLGGAMLAVALVAAPAASDAAWWPWSKREKAQQEAQPEQPPQDPALAQPEGGDRLARIEAQMRNLTGQIEEMANQMRLLQDQLKRVQDDADYRFQELEGGRAKPRKALAPAEPEQQTGGVLKVEKQPAEVAEPPPVDDTGLAPPPRQVGTLTLEEPPPQGEQPIDLTAIARGTADPAVVPAEPAPAPAAIEPQPDVMVSLADPRAAYEQSYNDILAGNYDRAEAGFRAFITAHPDDQRAPDAQYWLGESLFARGKYREAANEFLNGHKAYPKSGKGADTLLKLGLSLAGLGERDAACSTYAQVLKQYPQASNAMRTRVTAEQASASC